MTNVPGLYYRLLKEDRHDARACQSAASLAGRHAGAGQFGERVPVPVTTFSPIATGGVDQQPITSFNYENIGVNIDITPRTHIDNDVTLALAISVTSISGDGLRRPADVRQPADQDDDSPEGRRDQHAGRPDSRRRAEGARWNPRTERHSGRRPPVRPLAATSGLRPTSSSC